jgi:hypothetical protein
VKLRPRRLALLCAALLFSPVALSAETVTTTLDAGPKAQELIGGPLLRAIDDTFYQDPRGYRHHGAATRSAQKRLTLTNTGRGPITGNLVVLNDQDWSSAEALAKSLRLSPKPGPMMQQLFAFWCDHVTHADSGVPGGKEPMALLNFWGYALCGDSTAALTRLATSYGVAARRIPLNGHVAAEYFYDDAWHILDADQNVCYLQLDNRTLASAADLRADPLLARRTKVFGRHAQMDIAAAVFNTALHEFIDPKEEKAMKHKMPPAPVRMETLFPGEKIIIHCDEAPERPLGRTDLRRWGTVREDALRVVEFVIKPKARQTAVAGELEFASGHPILRAVNHTTSETVTTPQGVPTFEIKARYRALDDQISVYCQRANASLPRLRKMRNKFLLGAEDSGGTGQLVAEWEPSPADVDVPVVTAALTDAAPTFHIQSSPAADLLWWQISATKDFAFVPPNFDVVMPVADKLILDPLTATFINAAAPYFLRVKGRHAGVWSEWSAPLEFRAEKPSRPAPAQMSIQGAQLHLTWPSGGEGCEYLVFGSNRLDFLPGPYATEEIVVMRDRGIEQSRPNKNLIVTVTKPELEFAPAFRFYRVITRRDGVLSVPGDLIITPPALAANLPPALVLQNRWRRAGETDEHVATEMPLR